MNLRIARKMAPPGHRQRRKRDKRTWWLVYSERQLLDAERRLGRAWRRANRCIDGQRKTSPDFFAMNRVCSRRQRQVAIART